ncbi:hypothetical protein HKD37_15G044257 [Glycine soja]
MLEIWYATFAIKRRALLYKTYFSTKLWLPVVVLSHASIEEMTLCMREGRALNAPNDPHSSDEDQVKVSEDGKVGWVSMMGARGSLFTLFNSSWKKFKTHFLKITLNPVYPDHINLFYKYYGETMRFPFYWQEFSQRFKSRTSPLLSPEDRGMNIKVLLNLPYSGDVEKALERELKLSRYANMEIKFKASLKDRRKIVKALNEKNSLMIGKIEIIKGIQKKIANHEKMVSMKAVENQKLVKAIESLNKNFNATVKDLEETKNTVKALND